MKNKLKSIIEKALTILINLFGIQKTIVFESMIPFSDSSLAIYNKISSETLKSYKVIWYSQSLENSYLDEERGIYFKVSPTNSNLSRIRSLVIKIQAILDYNLSEIVIFTHESYFYVKSQKGMCRVNATHGTSFKDTRGRHPSQKFVDYILVTSFFMKEIRALTYEGYSDKILVTGLPRNDFLKTEGNKNELNYVLWLPTYRQHKNGKVKDVGDRTLFMPDKMDYIKINNFLKTEDFKLYIKPHPAQDLSYLNIENFSNIQFIDDKWINDRGLDLYEFIGKSEGLISDYSSVFIDYYLTDKPMAFFVEDFDSFSKFIVPDITKHMHGYVLKDVDDIILFLEDVLNKEDKYKDERRNHLKMYHYYQDFNSTNRVIEIVENEIKDVE